MSNLTCINCNQEHAFKFCPQCGQPSQVKRLSLRQLFNDIQERFLGIDNLFMRTFVDLWRRPGTVIHTLFSGNRRKYIGAGGYLFLMLSLMILLFDIFSVDTAAFYSGTVESINESQNFSERQKNVQEIVNGFINQNLRLINFALLPFYALLSMLFFKKSKLNIIEHASIFSYAQAQPIWLTIVAGLIFNLTGYNGATWLIWLSYVYSTWVLVDFFKQEKMWVVILKSIAIQILVMVLIGLLGAIGVFFYLLVKNG